MKIEKGQVKSPSRPSPRPSTSVAGRFFLCRSIRLDGKQAATIDISVHGAVIFGQSRSPFPDISSHLRTFSRRLRTLSVEVLNCPIACAVPSCLSLSRAVCLKKIAPPILTDGRGDLVENDGVPCLTVIERQKDGFWKKTFPNKSVVDE